MDIWRICKRRNLDEPFSGKGAEKTGGRWNSRGTRLVYASQNLSLAALELFVHVEPDDIPGDLVSIRATLPDVVSQRTLEKSDLPRNWRTYPSPPKLQQLGDDWVASMRSLILVVPSAINPEECNVLLNPQHPEMESLQVARAKPFRFDPRMFGK